MSTIQTKRNDEFGFKENVAECTTGKIVSEEMIPKYEKLEKTAMVADKYCLICLKSGMNLEKLSDHLLNFHNVSFYGDEDDDPAEEWIDQADSWKRSGSPSPITSESENEVSDNKRRKNHKYILHPLSH